MWRGRSVSVVMPTHSERPSIQAVIQGFVATGLVDEILIVNNNAEPGTSEEVSKTPAREIFENRPGMGFAVRRGLAAASGDLVVLCEPDATFLPGDIEKLLVYSQDFDVVLGTRTTRQLIWSGANMSIPLKWGNWAVAKLEEVLFSTSSLSDVGCTYRLMRREVIARIKDSLTIGGSHCLAELTLQSILSGARYVEIPLNYLPRRGVSTITGTLGKAMLVGWRMVAYILWFRLRTLGRKPRPAAPGVGASDAGAANRLPETSLSRQKP